MLLTLFAFILALGLLVTFHELGHYWVARRAGVPIVRFSVGFGPVLLRRRDRHGTEWAVSAIPLGGYVKMLDEAPPGADETTRRAVFNAQPLIWRAAVVAAGPAANLALAALIYAFLGLWGTQEPAAVLAAPQAGTPAAQAGVRDGDTLTAVAGEPVASWTQARWRLAEPLSLGGAVALTLQSADGSLRTDTLRLHPQDVTPGGADPLLATGLALRAPVPVVGELVQGGAAEQAGLRTGDQILMAGDMEHPSVEAFVRTVQAHAGQPLPLVVLRQGARVALSVTPRPERGEDGLETGRIGALIQAERPLVLVRLGPVDSLWQGMRRTADMSLFTLRMMGRMVVGDVSWKNVTGPVTIAEYAGRSARVGLESYLGFLALISISIGVLNLLPIPMLDGGHLLFYLIEALRGGRPLSDRVRDLSHRLGLGIVLGLMVLALFNDFSRLFS
ncbi:MAG: RIP metalloprotease RseP [Castellaniella sp.]|uniref:RIP metalloprotease RseP n=1 Tax=Castellaniella sp. TaxID=1955812 RepID=UPI002A35FFDD|nr:RIP metalloprotease RseP [Castellaniella sp.]MDY0308209.1 RIP metalloprotease RseP [Castellaniella sp.]